MGLLNLEIKVVFLISVECVGGSCYGGVVVGVYCCGVLVYVIWLRFLFGIVGLCLCCVYGD